MDELKKHGPAYMDYLVMLARTHARLRGATPADIERNVMRFTDDNFPIRVVYGFGC